MTSDRSSVISPQSSLLLVLLTISSFLFYGVVGADKTWLLAPAYLLSYATITIALLKRAWSRGQGAGRSEGKIQRIAVSGRTSELRSPISMWLWIIFVIYGIAMIPQAVVPFESKLMMLFVGGVVGAYIVWSSELKAFKDNRMWLGVLIFVVMLTALYGLIIHFKCPEKVLWADRYTDAYEGRLRSTYICPNHFAHLLQMLLPFCLALVFIPQTGMFLRLLSIYSFLVFLPPLFLTESRAGWLGSIAAVGVVVCLMALRRSKALFVFLLIFVPLFAVLLLFGAWKYSETFQRRANPVVQFLQGQTEGGVGSEARDFRPQTWMDTIEMIKEAPLIGFGPGNYRYTYPEHRKRFKGVQIVTGHPHNEYLELVADFGLIGLGLFALAWVYGLVRILIASLKADETRHAFIGFAFIGTAVGTMVHSFFDFEMHVYPNAMVFALLASIAIGPLFSARRKVHSDMVGHKRTQRSSRRVGITASLREDGGRKTAETGLERKDGWQSTKNGRSIQSRATRNYQPESETATPAQRPSSSSVSLFPLWLTKSGLWLLAVAYLVSTGFCIQIMSSSFIRSMGDRAAELNEKEGAEQWCRLAVKIDPQNWRGYKSMASQLSSKRYYSLDMPEKIQLAHEESTWFERAYNANPKDPEILTGWGKSLIFLGHAESRERGAGSMEQAVVRGWQTSTEADVNSLNINPLQVRGLDLLRMACRYRPFNDVFWWTLGIELRKVGLYEAALATFKQADYIKRSPSTRMNIRWIEKRLSEVKKSGNGDAPEVAIKKSAEPEIKEPAPLLDFNTPEASHNREFLELLEFMEK